MLRNSPTALRVLKAAMNADEDGQAGIQLVSNPDVVGQENGLRRPSKHSVRMARLLSNAGWNCRVLSDVCKTAGCDFKIGAIAACHPLSEECSNPGLLSHPYS
eukprot:1136864-Pelagomonas_calceolata.AAC.17